VLHTVRVDNNRRFDSNNKLGYVLCFLIVVFLVLMLWCESSIVFYMDVDELSLYGLFYSVR
jgi:hypothetical protein